MSKTLYASDGKLVLRMRPGRKGWYEITYPMDFRVRTHARTLEEAFERTRGALRKLKLEFRRMARPQQRRATATRA